MKTSHSLWLAVAAGVLAAMCFAPPPRGLELTTERVTPSSAGLLELHVRLRNQGTVPRRIRNVAGSCDCIDAESGDGFVLSARQSRALRVTVDTKARRAQGTTRLGLYVIEKDASFTFLSLDMRGHHAPGE